MNLITGGTGLLGTRLLFDLLKKGEKVRSTKRPNSSLKTVQSIFKYYGDHDLSLFQQIEWVNVNLLDITEISDAFEGISKVYHCAAVVSFHHSDYEEMYETNVIGTQNIVNTCLDHQVEVLCHVSSTAAIGKTNLEFQKEDNPWKNAKDNSYYSVCKYTSESEVWRGKEEGLNVVIVNPCIIVGPSDWNRSSTTLFKTIKKGLKYYTSGANAYVDVRDVTQIMTELVEKEIYNERFLCIGENMTYLEFFTLIAENFGVKPPSILAKQWQANLLWKLSEIKFRLTGIKPVITKETAASANKTTKFSNDKLVAKTGFKFRKINESVAYTCDYLSSNSSSN